MKASPSRKSRRLKSQPAENRGLVGEIREGYDDGRDDDEEGESTEPGWCKKHLEEQEKDRMLKYQRLLAKHKGNGSVLIGADPLIFIQSERFRLYLYRVRIPATASYAHTVRRVVSMTKKALANRIKSIERAAGMYAVVKMRMFAEVGIQPCFRFYDSNLFSAGVGIDHGIWWS